MSMAKATPVGRSPPTRGAWIEMYIDYAEQDQSPGQSPPTRGAWIEIDEIYAQFVEALVAPHTGGVD